MTDTTPGPPEQKIAFQGTPGAYSHLACREAFPDMTPLPCEVFEDAFSAVREDRARLAMIAIENSLAGRVADVHHLMPDCGLHIVGEHFQRVNHQLLALPGTELAQLRVVHSHVHALGQCRRLIRELGLTAAVHVDTAGAAAQIAAEGRRDQAAIASTLAAEIYGLEVVRGDVEDADHNTTRFVVLSRDPQTPAVGAGPCITTFLFQVRNVPAALYKAMGGFATNGVNMTKLESYLDGGFVQAQFYADIFGHQDDPAVRRAFDELRFFSQHFQLLGTYPADPFRFRQA